MLRWFRRRPGRVSTRQMHQDEAYIFGEGQPESNRLDMQHFMFRWEFDGDFSAPVRNPLAILDVACGTGRWARDVARRFPRASVFAFDFNRDQLDRALLESEKRGEPIPANCTFATGDALQRFDFPDHSFQLVMARANSAYMPIDRWPSLLNEMIRVTAPNGWMEVRDFGLVRSESMALTAMTGMFANLAAGRGIHPGVGPYLPKYFAQLPLREHHIQTRTVRAGPRSTRGGRLMLADYLALMDRITPLMVRANLTSEAQWRQLWQQARQETNRCITEVELTAAFGRT
jgi:ubiquinone/menaquinone biosynthesis C-methylase UbiE